MDNSSLTYMIICFTFFNYAGDKNLFSTGTAIKTINQKLLFDFRTVNKWFYENFITWNTGKYHFMSAVKCL